MTVLWTVKMGLQEIPQDVTILVHDAARTYRALSEGLPFRDPDALELLVGLSPLAAVKLGKRCLEEI
ncbi:hypothetical protein ANTPLA_LOCUS3369 [Anthophora plagiata]